MVAIETDLPPIAKPVLVNIGDKDAVRLFSNGALFLLANTYER